MEGIVQVELCFHPDPWIFLRLLWKEQLALRPPSLSQNSRKNCTCKASYYLSRTQTSIEFCLTKDDMGHSVAKMECNLVLCSYLH